MQTTSAWLTERVTVLWLRGWGVHNECCGEREDDMAAREDASRRTGDVGVCRRLARRFWLLEWR